MSSPILKSFVPEKALKLKDDVLKRVKITAGLTELQKNILHLAHERLLKGEGLSLGEILIVLYGWRPEKQGLDQGRKLSLDEALMACRLEPYKHFNFSDEAERDKYHLAHASVFQTVARLVKKGLVIKIRTEMLIWPDDDRRADRIDYDQMLRLTEEGEKIVNLFSKTNAQANCKE
jgi:hypothetical protein